MKFMKKTIILIVVLAMLLPTLTVVYAADPDGNSVKINPVSGIGTDFIMGADVSMLKDIETYGGKYYDVTGGEKDCLAILKAHGVNWIRLRIWNDPVTDASGKVGNDTVLINGNPAPEGTKAGAGTCDEATVTALAARAKVLGMKVLLDFHYSDFWADPGKQTKPKAWANLTGSDLQDAVYNYTHDVLDRMNKAGAMPDMVQIGNETNNGMMFPDGNIANGFAGWIGLINAASKAVRDIGGKNTRIMIHLANGGDNSLYRKVFDKLTNFSSETNYVAANDKYNDGKTGIDFDVIGFSYYPFWHGKLNAFKANMQDISQRYGKEVAVAEIGYGYTFDNGDSQSNAFGQGMDELSGYQATVQGQAQLLRDVIEVVSQMKDSLGNSNGIGVFYWEPEWIPVLDANGNNQVGWITGGGNDSDNRALFDFTGRALPSLDVFNLVKKNLSDLPGGKLYTYEISGLRDSSTSATVGELPVLPNTVLADFNDGTIRAVPVKWDNIDTSKLSKLQDFTVMGSVDGTVEKAVLKVTVIGKKNYVTDPSFESGNLSAWTVTKDSASDVEIKNESSPGNNAYTGDCVFSYYISPIATGFTMQQTITGLPNGVYTLGAVSHGGDIAPVTRYMFAKEYGGNEKKVDFVNTGWQKWVFPDIKHIIVSNGQCTIGVRVETAGVGTWGKLDDFELYPDLSSANLILPYSIDANSQFDVKLSYSKLIYNVYAQDVTINYNANKLEYVSAAGVNTDTLVTAVDSSKPGTVRILAANTGSGGISWNADSLKLTFRTKAGVGIANEDLTIAKALLGITGGSVAEPSGLVTLRTAKPSDNGSSSGSSSSNAVPVKSGVVAVSPPVVVDGTARVTVDSAAINSAFASATADNNGIKTVTIPVSGIEGQSSYESVLPVVNLASGASTQKIRITTDVGSIAMPANMLLATDAAVAQNVSVKIAATSAVDFGSELRTQIGDRPVIELSMKIDGKPVLWNNPNAPVTVSVPYKPNAEELKDPEHIVIWYIDGNGKAFTVPNCKYDPVSGMVIFTTTHFSKYAVAFSHKTFSDLKKYEWARNAVEVLASKGVVEGTSNGCFSPETNITRADFTVMLVKALGLSAKFTDNFTDIKDTDYYFEAAGIARKLGISGGTGSNRFNPREYITRQDLIVMTQRALNASGKLSVAGVTAQLDGYSDRGDISQYAYASISRLVGEGLIVGSNNALKPREKASRAEAAVIIYRAAKK